MVRCSSKRCRRVAAPYLARWCSTACRDALPGQEATLPAEAPPEPPQALPDPSWPQLPPLPGPPLPSPDPPVPLPEPEPEPLHRDEFAPGIYEPLAETVQPAIALRKPRRRRRHRARRLLQIRARALRGHLAKIVQPPALPPEVLAAWERRATLERACAVDPELDFVLWRDGDPEISLEEFAELLGVPPEQPFAPAAEPVVVQPPVLESRPRNRSRKWLPSLPPKKIEADARKGIGTVGEDELDALEQLRPHDRSQCRPARGVHAAGSLRIWEETCPFVGCRYNLALDVSGDTGSIKELIDWDDHRGNCALDLADAGEATLEEVGALTGVTRERVRQIEVRGLIKLAIAAGRDPMELGLREAPLELAAEEEQRSEVGHSSVAEALDSQLPSE